MDVSIFNLRYLVIFFSSFLEDVGKSVRYLQSVHFILDQKER